MITAVEDNLLVSALPLIGHHNLNATDAIIFNTIAKLGGIDAA